MSALFRDLFIGLKNLDFLENFNSYETSITIAAGSTKEITNGLKTIPSKWIITRAVGSRDIVEGNTTWTRDLLYLKNNGAAAATITVIFFK